MSVRGNLPKTVKGGPDSRISFSHDTSWKKDTSISIRDTDIAVLWHLPEVFISDKKGWIAIGDIDEADEGLWEIQVDRDPGVDESLRFRRGHHGFTVVCIDMHIHSCKRITVGKASRSREIGKQTLIVQSVSISASYGLPMFAIVAAGVVGLRLLP